MSNEDKIQIFKPFGPPIAKFELKNNIIKKINSYVDELIEDKQKSAKLDAGKSLAGQVNQEIEFEKNFKEEVIIPALLNQIKNYVFINTKKKFPNTLLKIFG